ncbi:MAG: ATP synthase F1 subunit gamma, partial [Acidobacteria bacterium]|nr:ATP synthase F1 subunit gamma [Acidobacteriota bacterium]
KAMKMVSAAKLRRAQERVVAARPYTIKMMEIMSDLSKRAPELQHPLLATSRKPVEGRQERVLLVLVTADKGLCGGFNTNLNRAATQFLRRHSGQQVELVLIGRKGVDYFRRRDARIRREYIGVTGTGRVSFADTRKIAEELIADFTAEENPVDHIYLIYNEFKSALSQRPVEETVLPIGRIPDEADQEQLLQYSYEQPPSEIFGTLLPKMVETQLYRALLESIASEHGARMTAMDSASKNANEVIDKLTLNMNRVRQAAITREIIEVVSGAAAL